MFKLGIEPVDLGDVVFGKFVALVSKAFAHLLEVLGAVDQLRLATSLGAFAVAARASRRLHRAPIESRQPPTPP